MFNRILLTAIVILLGGCGGGGGGGGADLTPVVLGFQAQSLRYGQSAVIAVSGQYLSSDMVADTGTCTKPSFSAASTSYRAILNCTVSAVGPLPITIRAANGNVLFSNTLTVLPPQVTMITSKGNIVMELNASVVPVTVNNFLGYVNSGFYANTLFHRVIAGSVVQGGGYTTGLVKRTGQAPPIALETNKGLLNARSTVAMARTAVPDSATTEFFVNLVDNASLDYKDEANPGYAVFGKVVKGMDVVDTIAAGATATLNGTADVPISEVTISLATQTQ